MDRPQHNEPHEPDLAALEASVNRMIADDRGPLARLRAWSRGRRFAVLAVAAALGAGLVYLLLRRQDLALYPDGRYAALAGSAVVVGLLSMWQALRPLQRPPLPGWVLGATIVVGVLVPVVAALLPELPTHHHAGPGAALACCAAGALFGTLWLVPLAGLARDGLRQLDRALFAAVAAGMAGVAALHLQCASNQPLHLLLGHASVPLVFLAAMAVRRLRGG